MSERDRSMVSVDGYIARVRFDHTLHWLAVLGVMAYAWQLHGWVAAALVGVGLILAITIFNMIVVVVTGSMRLIRFNRWAWVVITFVAVAFSGASIGNV